MPWRDLPPRLRCRVRRVTAYEALPALVLTPVLGAVWLFGPIALALLFLARGDYALAAVLVPLALVWTYAMVRERLLPGLLLAWPAAVWSVVQQWRGKVDTEDLEEGRLVTLGEWRTVTSRERDVLDLLARAVPDLPEIREQVAQSEVMAECICGCPSIRLFSTGPAVPRDEARGNAHGERDDVAIAASATDSRGAPVDVVLRLALGHVRELEVTSGGGHDGGPDELPAATRLRVSRPPR